MKPAPFEYKAPDSIDEALMLLRDSGSDAKLLAGGQSLVPAMNFRVARPSVLIDLNRIVELQYIRHSSQTGLQIGAMTRERELESDAVIASRAPLLAEAVLHVAHPQIRNRGTLGGSLAHADPAAELPVVMLALGARLKVRSPSADRSVDAPDFFSGMFTTDLAPDEMLTEIELPDLPPRTGWSFQEVAPRAGDYALMGIAALVGLDGQGKCLDARLVYLNAGDGPVVAVQAAHQLQGEVITDANIDSAAGFASEKEIQPFGNVHASPQYQRHLARVLTGRALREAVSRARDDHSQ
jgi:carbon-monoxide dehydrogenase medium subunit